MSDPDLTPEEQEVRRLLADARHDEPLPADIADRLDGVLADLARETPRTSPVVDLASRRRRRVARNILIAAAAVVVVGVGNRNIDLSSSGGDSADSGASSALEAPESAPDDSTAGGDSADSATSGHASVPGARRLPLSLTSSDFDRRVSQSDLGALIGSTESYAAAEASGATTDEAPRGRCNDPAWGRGTRVAARYDGQPAVLVLRKPVDGTRQVDLFLCGATTPTRSRTVPVG
jgi:hypothetical protein